MNFRSKWHKLISQVNHIQFQPQSIPTISSHHFFFCFDAATQRGSWPPHAWGFLDHTQWRTTVGRTPLDEWSARRRDLYLTTHNTHNRQTSMPPSGVRTHDLSRWAAVDLSLRPRGHWDKCNTVISSKTIKNMQSSTLNWVTRLITTWWHITQYCNIFW